MGAPAKDFPGEKGSVHKKELVTLVLVLLKSFHSKLSFLDKIPNIINLISHKEILKPKWYGRKYFSVGHLVS